MIITNIFTQTLFFTFYIIAFPSEFRNSNKRDTIDNSPDISSTTLVDDILNTTDLPVQETSVVPAVDQIISEVVQETSIVEVPAVEQTIPDTVFTTILVSANGTPVPFYSSDNIEPTETPVVVLEEPIPAETPCETLVPNSTTKILIIPTETCEIVTIVMTTFLTTVLTTAEISSPTNLPICIQPTNFCDSTDSSIIPSNGTQNIISSCSSTVQGVIPSVEHLVSTLILEPVNGDILVSGQNVTIIIKTLNMNFGFFDNPNTEYYAEPQTLDVNGSINGHSHITIEKILDDNSFPDPKAPIFFKGLEQSINFEGNLSVDIDSSILSESGAGTYRICTITSSSSHQPVLMPIARRGATDDCIRVIVI